MVAALLAAAPAWLHATQVVDMGGVGMNMTYNAGTGLLSINKDNGFAPVDFLGGTVIFVAFNDGSSDQFGAPGPADSGNGDFILTGLTLTSDTSSGSTASGRFGGGHVVLRDQSDNLLFQADIDQLALLEVQPRTLSGAGTYINGVTTVPGADPLPASGGIIGLLFGLNKDISNFTQSFTGSASVDFVPDPPTFLFLASALPLMFLRRHRGCRLP